MREWKVWKQIHKVTLLWLQLGKVTCGNVERSSDEERVGREMLSSCLSLPLALAALYIEVFVKEKTAWSIKRTIINSSVLRTDQNSSPQRLTTSWHGCLQWMGHSMNDWVNTQTHTKFSNELLALYTIAIALKIQTGLAATGLLYVQVKFTRFRTRECSWCFERGGGKREKKRESERAKRRMRMRMRKCICFLLLPRRWLWHIFCSFSASKRQRTKDTCICVFLVAQFTYSVQLFGCFDVDSANVSSFHRAIAFIGYCTVVTFIRRKLFLSLSSLSHRLFAPSVLNVLESQMLSKGFQRWALFSLHEKMKWASSFYICFISHVATSSMVNTTKYK